MSDLYEASGVFQSWEEVKAAWRSLKIIYEDKDICICQKGPGLAVETRSIGQPDVVSKLRSLGHEVYLVHRLDQPVQGLLAVAYHSKAAADLSRQLQNGTMKKDYLAVCQIQNPDACENAHRGTPCVLEHWLIKDKKTNLSRVVPQGTAGGKKARLSYEILEIKKPHGGEKEGALALVQIHLETGRHHQIRVQLAQAGMPILGDGKYGVPWGADGGRQLLHLCACSLRLQHPVTGQKVEYSLLKR